MIRRNKKPPQRKIRTEVSPPIELALVPRTQLVAQDTPTEYGRECDAGILTEYQCLLMAMVILNEARRRIDREEGTLLTPHYCMVLHAEEYVKKEADRVLRG